uniref:Uncharacterized protein n=1 Tax=Tanacetum cinerariifolium TaxID=118510 RepID=A0A6L2J7G0_TANCI|nr:hypothetical protein [Tanacetum cinerariifolium]
MMRIKMKNPLLDQTGGLRDEEKEKSHSQQALQRKRRPKPLASLIKGPNLIKRLQAKASQHPEWFQQQKKPPTPNRAWNKTLPATYGSIQPWISDLAKQADSRSSFNELMDTHMDFSAFIMNRIKLDTLTPELLAGPTYELMKGSCKSLVELEFFLEEVYKATTDQLDWNNPEGQRYPHNLLKPLPLIPNSRGRRVIPFDHFINNDLEYLRSGASSRKYITFVTKTKAADYGYVKWIEDLFYEFAVNRESARDVYSKRRLIAVTELQIVEWHDYKHLDWITVRRDDDKLYKFKEGDFKRLHIQDIEDMKTDKSLDRRTLCFQRLSKNVHKKHRRPMACGNLQLGVKSHQKKLNLTKPDTYHSDLKRKEAYTAYSNPRGFIYHNKDKHNRLMWIDEFHKDSHVTSTKHRRMTKPYSSHRFIANCFNASHLKMDVKHPNMVRFYRMYGNVMRRLKKSGTGDEDYYNRALLDYEAKIGVLFKLYNCWEDLKGSLKWMETEVLKFLAMSGEDSGKRYKTSGSSSFNTDFGEASINLNVDVGDDEEDEVREIRRPIGRDKTNGSMNKKGQRALGSSSTNDDALASWSPRGIGKMNVRPHPRFSEIRSEDLVEMLFFLNLDHLPLSMMVSRSLKPYRFMIHLKMQEWCLSMRLCGCILIQQVISYDFSGYLGLLTRGIIMSVHGYLNCLYPFITPLPSIHLAVIHLNGMPTIIQGIGNMIHCYAKATVSHNFLRLKEGGIYFVKNFAVKPNKDKYRIMKNDVYMLEFDGSKTIRKASIKADGFVRCLFQLQDFDGIELSNNKYLIDVVGYVTNIESTNHLKSGSKNLDFYLANHRYRLEVDVSDNTAHAVVVMFNETATALVNCSADSLMDTVVESLEDHLNLPSALSNLIDSSIKRNRDSVGSSNLDDYPNNQLQKLKRIVHDPSIITPSKPVEERKKPRMDVKDSKTEDSSDLTNATRKKGAVEPSAKKRKNWYIHSLGCTFTYIQLHHKGPKIIKLGAAAAG